MYLAAYMVIYTLQVKWFFLEDVNQTAPLNFRRSKMQLTLIWVPEFAVAASQAFYSLPNAA